MIYEPLEAQSHLKYALMMTNGGFMIEMQIILAWECVLEGLNDVRFGLIHFLLKIQGNYYVIDLYQNGLISYKTLLQAILSSQIQ